MGIWGSELWRSVRTQVRRPAVAIVTSISLGLGVGVATTTFSIGHPPMRRLPWRGSRSSAHATSSCSAPARRAAGIPQTTVPLRIERCCCRTTCGPASAPIPLRPVRPIRAAHRCAGGRDRRGARRPCSGRAGGIRCEGSGARAPPRTIRSRSCQWPPSWSSPRWPRPGRRPARRCNLDPQSFCERSDGR